MFLEGFLYLLSCGRWIPEGFGAHAEAQFQEFLHSIFRSNLLLLTCTKLQLGASGLCSISLGFQRLLFLAFTGKTMVFLRLLKNGRAFFFRKPTARGEFCIFFWLQKTVAGRKRKSPCQRSLKLLGRPERSTKTKKVGTFGVFLEGITWICLRSPNKINNISQKVL